MSEADRQRLDRSQRAEKIAANPSAYKVCEGCESIVAAPVTICPNCYGYRFDGEAERVVAQALLLGSREQRSVISDDLT